MYDIIITFIIVRTGLFNRQAKACNLDEPEINAICAKIM